MLLLRHCQDAVCSKFAGMKIPRYLRLDIMLFTDVYFVRILPEHLN